MILQKAISQILIFALVLLFCIFTAACTPQDGTSGISINHDSKLKELQKQNVQSTKIVYLGSSNEKNYDIGNFGPRDIYFDDEVNSLR